MRACAALNSPSPAFSAKSPPGGNAAIQTYSPPLLVNTPPGKRSSSPSSCFMRFCMSSIDSSSPNDTNSGFFRRLISLRSLSRIDSRSSSEA